MSDLIRIGLIGEFRARVLRIVPDATPEDMTAFEALVARDCLVDDKGAPHPELVAWVQAILSRRGGAESVAAVVPVKPVPGAAGALIGGVV
jgi:hypothetical protein